MCCIQFSSKMEREKNSPCLKIESVYLMFEHFSIFLFLQTFFHSFFYYCLFIENEKKNSMLLYLNICISFFSCFFSILTFDVCYFRKHKSRPFILAFLCGYAKKSKLLYILNTCYASISALPIKSNQSSRSHSMCMTLTDVFVCAEKLCACLFVGCFDFRRWTLHQIIRHKKKQIPINLVFFKGWSITLRCHSSRRWRWAEPEFYHRQSSTDTSQREWAAVCQADGIPIPTKRIGASKGWTMIHDFHFVDQTSTEQTIHNTIDACAPRNIAIIHHLKCSIFKMPSIHRSNIIKLNSIGNRATDKFVLIIKLLFSSTDMMKKNKRKH